ncbi:thioredoxin-2 [[Candida] anglica]|uniref:Thioredoxin-2 n=1 Tax=[Candida] anglica TaxID=148631 RepID=A0ABP0EF59_9ASCO
MFRTATRFTSPMRQAARSYVRSVSTVREIGDLSQFKQFVKGDKVSVIDFYATWCGPCKALEPIFAALAEKVPEVQFGRVDVDNAQDVAQEYGITAMPTCLFFKDGEKVDTIIGANPPKLISLIKEHGKVNL